MRKTFLLALGALMSISAWSFDNVPATFTWTEGNEAEATVAAAVADGVSKTQRKVGTALTEGERNNLAANAGVAMVTYTPASNKPGTVAEAMIEYSVKMKKGVTFTLTNIDYDAIKQGTNGASYHWTYAVDGTEATLTQVGADDIVRDNNTSGTPALHHSHAVTASAGREVAVRFYVSGFDASKLLCLCNIVMTGTVNGEEEVRAFTNFKVELRTNPYSVIEPASLPAGVTITCPYHDGQHGAYNGDITVPVDGPVKFTIGACQHSGSEITVQKDGEDFATINNNTGACGETEGQFINMVTWTYNKEEAATLVFHVPGNTYVPFFFAEACEFVPQVEVRYYDTDGKTLIGEPQIVDGGSELAFAYGVSDVTVAEGKAFRGWFNGTALTAKKVAEGISLTEDLSLYAKATDIEEAALGKIYNYDFRKDNFYPEDHEVLTFDGGSYKDATHGWVFKSGNSLSVDVAGNALLVVGVCKYSETGATKVTDGEGQEVGELLTEKEVTGDGALQTIQYEGPATKLTISFTTTNYIHTLKVYNIAALPKKNELGYYEIAPNDGAGLILALDIIEAGDKIFLPNGTYDFGEESLIQISKSNVSIIGESMDKTIIKNAPDWHNEGLGKSVTILIPSSVSGTYFQDLTIQNAMDYYAAIAGGMPGGRGAALQDEGTQTVLKNVRLLSYQDTYYSKKSGAKHYFEDCEIHGTVDYICGAASVYFKNNLLYCEKRQKNGGGQDCITAHTGKDANGDKGYVFEGCTIKSECPTVSLGRAWGDDARTYFLNTLVDKEAGEFSFTGNGVQRWSITGINGNPKEFGEYNTHLADGSVLNPASNIVTFNKNGETQMETVLSADRAAELTMEYTLGEWAATAAAETKQVKKNVSFEDGVLSWNASEEGVYLVYIHSIPYCITSETSIDVTKISMDEIKDMYEIYFGNRDMMPTADYYVRFANGRGGFGPAVHAWDKPEGIEDTAAEAVKATKIMRDGQVIIVRDNREYTVFGTQL